MNFVSVTYIASAFIAFESAFTVFRLDRRSPLNIVYAAFALDFCLCCLLYNQFMTAPDNPSAWFWNRACIIPFFLLPVLVTHFASLLTLRKSSLNPWILLSFYVPAAFFIIVLLRGRVVTDIFPTPWGWDNLFDASDPLSALSILYLALSFTLCATLIFYWRFRWANGFEQLQARPIVASYLIGGLGCFACLLFYFTDDPNYVTMASNMLFAVLGSVFILGVRYAVGKYKLMSFSAESTAAELMAGIDEPLFLTDFSGKIVYRNRAAEGLPAGEGTGAEGTIFQVFSCDGSIRRELENIQAGRTACSSVSCVPVKSRDTDRAFTLHLKAINREAGSPAGVIMLARGDNALRDFRERFRITERQMDIIFLALSGQTNREIAERLSLSERTVENHLFNIYNRLGIDNRIELYNMALKYNIISN